MRIITVSRQFGSGGRELGKRLSDLLGWDYYDKEIIEALADEHDMDPEAIRRVLSHHGWHSVQLTYKNSFSHLGFDHSVRTRLLVRQREIIREIAEAGNDCIIVGRDADVILQEYHPFRVYVCAELAARTERCLAHERKKAEAERLSEKEIVRNIRRIDKNRMHTREILTGKAKSDASSFDLTVNATAWEIRQLAPAVADFAMRWFDLPDHQA
ncbi:MAG: cytidylate kinase-like family protein [Oscillospiraceae bacterium]|nr:cytidylate kinase-like family protein [Oscillospiraceae bacterium]